MDPPNLVWLYRYLADDEFCSEQCRIRGEFKANERQLKDKVALLAIEFYKEYDEYEDIHHSQVKELIKACKELSKFRRDNEKV